MSDSIDDLYREQKYAKWLKGNVVLTPPESERKALEDYFFKLNTTEGANGKTDK